MKRTYRPRPQRTLGFVFPTSREDFGNGLGQRWLFCNHEHGLHLVLRPSGRWPFTLQSQGNGSEGVQRPSFCGPPLPSALTPTEKTTHRK